MYKSVGPSREQQKTRKIYILRKKRRKKKDQSAKVCEYCKQNPRNPRVARVPNRTPDEHIEGEYCSVRGSGKRDKRGGVIG